MAKNEMNARTRAILKERGIRPAQSVKINERLSTQIYNYISKEDSNFIGVGEFVRYCVARYLEDRK
jgi:5-bromo-4-chloroindolyl phosphate hydrolysis protein